LAESELFGLMLATAEAQPLTLLLVGVLLGALLSSTNGAAAGASGLVAGDAVSLTAAVAAIAGCDVGGTVLPLLPSGGLDPAAHRVALSHVLVKGLGALAVVFAAEPLVELIARLGGDGARQVANAHTFFNLAAALVFTPVAGPVTRAVAGLVPTADRQGTR